MITTIGEITFCTDCTYVQKSVCGDKCWYCTEEGQNRLAVAIIDRVNRLSHPCKGGTFIPFSGAVTHFTVTRSGPCPQP